MARKKADPRRFWIGVFAGFIVMVILNIFVVSLISTIVSFFSTLFGGFVAGWIAEGGLKDGGKAGLFAGLLNAVFMAIFITVFGIRLSPADLGLLGLLGSTFLIVIALVPLWGLLGYFGGALAGLWRNR